jgi:SAM-dependent methyltransferase
VSAAPAWSAPALEDVACPLCAARERRLRFRDEPFGVWICAGCDLTYVSPRVPASELLERVYDASYWRSAAPRLRGYRDYAGAADEARATWARRLDALAAHLPPGGDALDVGCAAGFFLEALAARGWRVHGLEPSAPMYEVAAARLGAHCVHRGTLADLPPRWPARFDLVTLWDVLEHLPDPVAALRRARAALAPGGRLVLETQNVASVAARVLGRRWHHYKHEEHLAHFHPGTLTRALAAAGLEVLALTPRGAGKVVRLDFLAERAGRFGLGRLLGPLLRLLVRAGNPACYVNPLDELVVVARAS